MTTTSFAHPAGTVMGMLYGNRSARYRTIRGTGPAITTWLSRAFMRPGLYSSTTIRVCCSRRVSTALGMPVWTILPRRCRRRARRSAPAAPGGCQRVDGAGRLESGRDGGWLLHVQRNARMHLRFAGGFDTMALRRLRIVVSPRRLGPALGATVKTSMHLVERKSPRAHHDLPPATRRPGPRRSGLTSPRPRCDSHEIVPYAGCQRIRRRTWRGSTAGRLAGGRQRGRPRSRGGRIAQPPVRRALAPGRPFRGEPHGGIRRCSSRLRSSARGRSALGPVVLRSGARRHLRSGPGSGQRGPRGTGQAASMTLAGPTCKRRRTCSGSRRCSVIRWPGRRWSR
jgi:hypothetical protein